LNVAGFEKKRNFFMYCKIKIRSCLEFFIKDCFKEVFGANGNKQECMKKCFAGSAERGYL